MLWNLKCLCVLSLLHMIASFIKKACRKYNGFHAQSSIVAQQPWLTTQRHTTCCVGIVGERYGTYRLVMVAMTDCNHLYI